MVAVVIVKNDPTEFRYKLLDFTVAPFIYLNRNGSRLRS